MIIEPRRTSFWTRADHRREAVANSLSLQHWCQATRSHLCDRQGSCPKCCKSISTGRELNAERSARGSADIEQSFTYDLSWELRTYHMRGTDSLPRTSLCNLHDVGDC